MILQVPCVWNRGSSQKKNVIIRGSHQTDVVIKCEDIKKIL